MDVRHAAEPKMISGMVEDDDLSLPSAVRRPRPDLLNEEDARFCRLGVNDAADVGVYAGRQDADTDRGSSSRRT